MYFFLLSYHLFSTKIWCYASIEDKLCKIIVDQKNGSNTRKNLLIVGLKSGPVNWFEISLVSNPWSNISNRCKY